MATFTYENIGELVELARLSEETASPKEFGTLMGHLCRLTSNHERVFQGQPLEEHEKLWDAIYMAGNTSWDSGEPSPALQEALESYPELFNGVYPDIRMLRGWVGHGFGYNATLQDPMKSGHSGDEKRKRALVPGYGMGYDAILLAMFFGYDVVGLDISENGLSIAEFLELDIKKSLQNTKFDTDDNDDDNNDEMYWLRKLARNSRGVTSQSGSIQWVQGDFFSDDWSEEGEKYDLIFDHQFFSAIPPSLRPQWSQRMKDLLARPHGRLVCHESPTSKTICRGGPPYGAASWFYDLHLTYPGNDSVIDYEKMVMDLSPEVTYASGPGLTLLTRFRARESWAPHKSACSSEDRD